MMKNKIYIHLLTGFTLLCMLPLGSRGQTLLTLDEVIRLAQDSAITSFQSQQEYRSRQASYEAFEALRKPQLSLKVVPNYSRIVSDPSRDYVYLRNYDIFSASAQLRLTQKVLPFGGEAYVGKQAIWSEFFREGSSGYPRQFVASPLLVGYSHTLLGYNPFRWEKRVEDQRLEAARQQHEYHLRRIAEEAAVRYFRLARQQRILKMRLQEQSLNDTLFNIAREKSSIAIVTLAELHSIEVQQQNAANLLVLARQNELKARTELASCTITALISGYVSKICNTLYGAAQPGDPLFYIVDIEHLKVSFAVLENELAKYENEPILSVTTITYPSERYMAKVSALNPVIDDNGMAHVEATLKPHPHLLPGMTAFITVIVTDSTNNIK